MNKLQIEELPLRRQLALNLVKTFNWVTEHWQRFFEAYGLTSQQYNVLKIIAEAERPLSTSEILNKMVEKSAGVSRLVDRLVIKNLVEKKINASDKRLIDVSLTPTGTALLYEIAENLEKVDEVYAVLDEEEAETLNRLLAKICQ
ncbi:DNA-binding transcriptional regulator, MarR family [Chitinophaga terrae (ex Kim and Jung 2007)]|uniref:DNA-binding transcriptional regulator, MarR family n=1 Tax=Chitinophaga terrae (ex Kim and Jung 2007) TaxID=408074 RepID=A0A1H4CIN0_9BACT|nr:MarR family transcriptional regulator [Chitinophaga terrae (ex Kim and Jung 2007)]GEP89004.1 MarR family transcriptional regulator [Chitinophaga terrae (ex Kim and Jung 2007)]SEA60265.1 DNA-binding transcriptional regulator, MarR family [Chitinophaga terrae (ex Kim and Jung 2007)]